MPGSSAYGSLMLVVSYGRTCGSPGWSAEVIASTRTGPTPNMPCPCIPRCA